MKQTYQDIVMRLKTAYLSVYIKSVLQHQVNQMISVFNYRMHPNECVSSKISFVQHIVNVRNSGFSNYNALKMGINTNVRTKIIS